jgi:integrase
MTIDANDLELWLREDGYAESTVQQTVHGAAGILERVQYGKPCAITCWPLARRMVRYARERGLGWANDPNLLALASNETARQAEREGRARKGEAKSFDDEGWRRLASAIVADPTREARVLEIIMLSGLRAGDALRIRRSDALEALETGRLDLVQKGGKKRAILFSGPDDPLREALVRALEQWQAEEEGDRRKAADMSNWLVPESSSKLPNASARRSLGYVLHRIGAVAKLRGKIHLHRIRRTIAVQALRSGADIPAVGQLLGHRPGSRATLGYIDEARLEDVADIRRRVNQKYLG